MVIVGEASQRLAVARYLSGCRHRVTLSSSVREARQMLGFVASEVEAPQAVVIDADLLGAEGEELREHLGRHFPATSWVPLLPDLSLDWLGGWLSKQAVRLSESADRCGERRLNILVIEAEPVLRSFMVSRLAARGDRIRACSSIEAAHKAFTGMCRRGHQPDVIVSSVEQPEGNALSFFLGPRKQCPDLRCVVSRRPHGTSMTAGKSTRANSRAASVER